MAYYGEAVWAGVFMGMVFMYMLVWLIVRMENVKFKRYLSERDDTVRLAIKADLDIIYSKCKGIADKSNTMMFKRKTNSINELICFLERYFY